METEMTTEGTPCTRRGLRIIEVNDSKTELLTKISRYLDSNLPLSTV